MISYQDFVQGMRSEIWPYPGEAQSQVAAHSKFFLEAFIKLVQVVPCLQQNHTDIFPACATLLDCGKTLVDAPHGEVRRVYTILNGDHCAKIFYAPADFARVDGWSRRMLSSYKAPLNTGFPALQQGLKYPEASTDSPFGRSRTGLRAVHRRRLYVVPWIQSNESLIVEWDGVKTDWKADDLLDELDWDPEVASAIKKYVQWCHQRDFGMFDTAAGEERTDKADWEEARADLIWRCQQRTVQREAETEEQNPLPTTAQLQAEKPVVVAAGGPSATVFAIIGGYGSGDAAAGQVAALVKGWKPEFIVSAGGNWFGTDLTSAAIDAAVGQFYSDYLFPYTGAYGNGAAGLQRFFPVLGPHDRDPVGRLGYTQAYFNLMGTYYQLLKGGLQVFFYDSGYDLSGVNQEADGVAAGSKQANWLQAALALSTARWRIVVLNHPPFSSALSGIVVPPLAADGTISYPDLQLPFKAWGADVVISGGPHLYERLTGSDGLTYIVNGAGGKDGSDPLEPATFHDPALGISTARYSADHGAIKATVDCDTLKLEFYSQDGVLRDALTLSQ